ncbi:MAG: c-type cytochrome [Variovorax sp.]|nr:MAG: c-type cytochrome [Variovorax sp.]
MAPNMGTAKIILLTTATLATAAGCVAAAMVFGGLYNVASTEQHTQIVYSVLERAMRQSVRLRARDIEAPKLDDEARVVRGATVFRDKCVQCHGAPGVAQSDIGKSMQPVPGPLVDAAQRWRPRELYWLTRHGIKMSGMPAWEFHLSDEELWSVVAFIGRLPQLSPQQYSQIVALQAPAAEPDRPSPASAVDVNRGKRALYQYACNACHTIPGVTGSAPNVGPPLAGMAKRPTIAGNLPNSQEDMVRWLRHTREVDPLTAMPELGVSERDARDIAAYLATLD